jgi:hypothetical protein
VEKLSNPLKSSQILKSSQSNLKSAPDDSVVYRIPRTKDGINDKVETGSNLNQSIDCQESTVSEQLSELSSNYQLSHAVSYKIVKGWVDHGFTERKIQELCFDYSLIMSGYTVKQLAKCELTKTDLAMLKVKTSDEIIRYGYFGFRRLQMSILKKIGDKNETIVLPSVAYCVCCRVRIRSLYIAYRHDVSHGVNIGKLISFGLNDPTGSIHSFSISTLESMDFSIGKSLQKRIEKLKSEKYAAKSSRVIRRKIS